MRRQTKTIRSRQARKIGTKARVSAFSGPTSANRSWSAVESTPRPRRPGRGSGRGGSRGSLRSHRRQAYPLHRLTGRFLPPNSESAAPLDFRADAPIPLQDGAPQRPIERFRQHPVGIFCWAAGNGSQVVARPREAVELVDANPMALAVEAERPGDFGRDWPSEACRRRWSDTSRRTSRTGRPIDAHGELADQRRLAGIAFGRGTCSQKWKAVLQQAWAKAWPPGRTPPRSPTGVSAPWRPRGSGRRR